MNPTFQKIIQLVNEVRVKKGKSAVEIDNIPLTYSTDKIHKIADEKQKIINEKIICMDEEKIENFTFVIITLKSTDFLPLESWFDKDYKVRKDVSKECYDTIFNIYYKKEDNIGVQTIDIENALFYRCYNNKIAIKEHNSIKKNLFKEKKLNVVLDKAFNMIKLSIDTSDSGEIS